MEDTIITHKEKTKKNILSYKDAGVDVNASNKLVEAIKPLAKMTVRKGLVSNLGGFGGIFDVKAAGFKDPILVAGTDGVGTKLIIARNLENRKTIGIDLVAMCVNDVVVQGAEPLFFLDYYSMGNLNLKHGIDVLSGITEGCIRANCSLIGGETAEMPRLYKPGNFDLAGFCIGAVERNRIISGKDVSEGDIVLGLASNGLHSNGFSLVQKVMETKNLKYTIKAPFDRNRILGNVFLEPTNIYVTSCLAAIKKGGVNALAHITGGGLIENIPRVLPEYLGASLDLTAWPIHPVFKWLSEVGNITPQEMLKTFNCGLGMIVIAEKSEVSGLQKVLRENGELVFQVGSVVKVRGSDQRVSFENLNTSWRN